MQLGTVVFLLIRPVRKYGFVLAYCSLQLLTSLLEVVVLSKFGSGSKQFRLAFWTDEIVLDLLLFLILILLTYRAMEHRPGRFAMGRALGVVTAMVIGLPFVVFKGAFVMTAWFNHTSQMLNFGAAILNLGLWTALLGSAQRDRKLLTVSAGFGVMATGVAVSFGLRVLVPQHSALSAGLSQIFVLSHLAGGMILCWAFRPVGRDSNWHLKPKPYRQVRGSLGVH